MSRRSKIATGIAIAVAGLTVLAILAAILITRSTWFGNYVREKIIVAVEDSTGGKVDLGSFAFDWQTMTVTARDFVIHGTEPPGSAPLFRAPLIVLKLKLFSTFEHAVDLQSLRADSPAVNVMIFENGDSNIPTPKTVSTSNQSGLERVVDLAIGRLDISDGSIQFQNRKIAFNAHGNNLKIDWLYDPAAVQYQGAIAMNPVNLSSGSLPPLDAQLNIPVVLTKTSIRVSNANIHTAQSKINLSGVVQNLSDPDIDGQMTAHLDLAEFARSFALPIYPTRNQAAEISLSLHSDPKGAQIRNASLGLGASHLEAAGDLRRGADVHGVIALGEIGDLLRLPQKPQGEVEIAGSANYLDSRYSSTGSIDAHEVSFRLSDSQYSGIELTSKFQVDPDLIAIHDLNLSALGGRFTGGAQVRQLKTIDASIGVAGFTLRGLASSLLKRNLNYGGAISATLEAHGDLKAPAAQARVTIRPQGSGVPVSGQIDASYNVSGGVLALDHSNLNLPHTRIQFSGTAGREIDLQANSNDLSDFEPALALASASAIPVTLRGGDADLHVQMLGTFANPSLNGNISLRRFAVSGRPFDRIAANFQASPSRVSIADGIVARNSLQARFSGSAGLHEWSPQPTQPLSAAVTIRNGDLADALALAGQNPAGTRGALNADVHIAGTIGNPQGAVQASAISGAIRNEPFDRIALDAALSDRLIMLQSLEAAAGQARIDAHGSFTHPRDSLETGRVELHAASSSISLDQFKTLDQWQPGLGGVVNFNADAIADLSNPGGEIKILPQTVNASLKATGLRDRSQTYGDLTATATTQGSAVRTVVASNFAGSSIQWNGVTQLTADYPTTAQASIHGLELQKVLAIVHRESIPARGLLSADASLSGTYRELRAAVKLELTHANIYGEPLDRAAGSVDYTSQAVNIPAFEINSPAGRVDLHGVFTHPAASFESGTVDLHVATTTVELQRVHMIEVQKPDLHGTLQFTGDFSGRLQTKNGATEVLPAHVSANGAVNDLSIGGHPLGGLKLQAQTAGNAIAVKLDSDIGKSAIHADANVSLGGNYPAQGTLTFDNVTYAGLGGLVKFESAPEGFEAAAAGKADFSGPLLQPSAIAGNLQITKLEISGTTPARAKKVALQNDGPLVAHWNQSTLRIESARFTGPSTHISIGGTAAFSTTAPLNLTIQADTDLAVIKQVYQGAFSGGSVTINSTVRGPLTQPLVNGQVQFKNASLQLEQWPNGIYNANGVVLLNGRTASIQSFTAESGGGKISLSGFVGFPGTVLDYDLRANANQIRVRYSGASVVANGALTMSGTSRHGLISGSVTVDRLAYNQQTDLGSILSGSGSVPPAETAENGLLSETRLHIRVQTAAGLQFETSAAQQLAATADLTVIGTLANPGMVGRVTITQGNLLFFGNKYTVNRGTIAFYDATTIRPVVNIDLQTLVQNVTVDITVSGPIENLKLSYHSDPPLRFEDIVALLATGRTPPDPTIAAQQPPAPNQGATQMGESALLGQAVANPVASRLQRVFGVSQLQVAPEFVTGTSIPQARVTLKQQVSRSVVFTYSQDLSQSNAELLRVEWELTPRFSAVATRDEFGIFGVDFFYRKQFH